jgi:5-methyltetrahydrofolate--homocysteine methyltransferase
VRPIATNPDQATQCVEMIRQIRERRAHTIVGLSNVSYGLPVRRHLNRTFLAMAGGAGLSAAIMDPTEPDMVATALAASCLSGEDSYCMNYIAAQRQGRL